MYCGSFLRCYSTCPRHGVNGSCCQHKQKSSQPLEGRRVQWFRQEVREIFGRVDLGHHSITNLDELIAAARDSLPLRGATQLRRGTKHHTPPRSSRRPTSEPDAPPSSARPKKGARKLAREQRALAAMPPKRPVRAFLLYSDENRARLRAAAPHLSPAEVMEAQVASN